MAFQNVARPRMYLNVAEYLSETGTAINPIFRTLPVLGYNTEPNTDIPSLDFITLHDPYIAILGHNATSLDIEPYGTSIINGDVNGTVVPGFSIIDLPSAPTKISLDGNIGSILIGDIYDFPVSPDMNLSLEYQYDGLKETTTKSGHTLSNSYYSGPPAWQGGMGAWELAAHGSNVTSNSAYSKSGRRVWSLSFSYLSDSSVFPDNAGLINETNDGNLSLLEDNTLQRAIHLCRGNQLPFIFCPDNTVDATSPKPDQLAIAKFDMKSFKFTQKSMNTYSIKMKIREIW